MSTKVYSIQYLIGYARWRLSARENYKNCPRNENKHKIYETKKKTAAHKVIIVEYRMNCSYLLENKNRANMANCIDVFVCNNVKYERQKRHRVSECV